MTSEWGKTDVDKKFEPLSGGEVISVDPSIQILIGHSTFRVSELGDALKAELIKQGIGGLTPDKEGWLEDDGIQCEVLRFGALGWQKGKVRIHLEFCPVEAEDAPAPKQTAQPKVAKSPPPVAPPVLEEEEEILVTEDEDLLDLAEEDESDTFLAEETAASPEMEEDLLLEEESFESFDLAPEASESQEDDVFFEDLEEESLEEEDVALVEDVFGDTTSEDAADEEMFGEGELDLGETETADDEMFDEGELDLGEAETADAEMFGADLTSEGQDEFFGDLETEEPSASVDFAVEELDLDEEADVEDVFADAPDFGDEDEVELNLGEETVEEVFSDAPDLLSEEDEASELDLSEEFLTEDSLGDVELDTSEDDLFGGEGELELEEADDALFTSEGEGELELGAAFGEEDDDLFGGTLGDDEEMFNSIDEDLDWGVSSDDDQLILDDGDGETKKSGDFADIWQDIEEL
ncbi:KGK domain-containing protein [Spirulina subsalsa]|uniref:KGK domain-containing protein n=1 Tax=Spirulina subsalsa TaxID=54311 RepID=UPI00036DB30F|nr:KGK domain-containing protein [Spirulina subsalsa]